LPLDKEREEGRTYTIVGGMHFGEDRFWCLGLGLTISGQRFLLDVGIAQSKGKTVVRLFYDGQPREIDLTNESERNGFYDFMVREISKYFNADALDNLDGKTTKQIGFHP